MIESGGVWTLSEVRGGLVTFFAPACGRVGPHVEASPGLQKTWIHHGGTAWLIGWWRDA